MSLIKTAMEHKQTKPMIVVGNASLNKMKRAKSFVSEDAIVMYANEYDIEDNFSIPKERGIIIDEVHYKPNTELIKKTLLEYRGQVVLISDNQKSVPKDLFSLCQLKRANKKIEYDVETSRADEPKEFDIDIYPMVREYLKNPDRDEVATMLKLSTPSDIHLLSWLAPNLHPNKLSFVDFSVKRRWNTDYFYELLAYSHDGRMARKMQMPKRGSYSKLPSLSRRVGLKPKESYLLMDLLKDESFKQFAKTKYNNAECRLLNLGEKKRRKKTDRIVPQQGLGAWF